MSILEDIFVFLLDHGVIVPPSGTQERLLSLAEGLY